MTPYTIRRAEKSDAQVLATLEEAAFGKHAWGADGVAGGFCAAGVEIVFCELEKMPPIGFAIWRAAAGEAELLSIGVVPDARGSGAGAALLGAVFDAAKRAGAGAIYLEVDPANMSAVRLYKRAGFTDTARRKAYYRSGADAVIMSKNI